jgi:hypothetical protein
MSKMLMWWFGVFFALIYFSVLETKITHAETPSASSNYKFEESTVGAGGLNDSNSNSYQGNSSTGDLLVGNTASGNYQIDTGSQTTNDPALSFNINNGAANFSTFSPTIPSTATSSFSISNYTSFGYVVQIIGNPPTNGTHTINPMAMSGSSNVGIEQFGINLVANATPVSFGSNPNNGQFGFGSVTPNYNIGGNFRYVSGETIAQAPRSSGITIYTISYLVNVSSVTPGGQYNSDQTIVITGTY